MERSSSSTARVSLALLVATLGTASSAGGCKSEDARPPVTNDRGAGSGGSGTALGDGGTSTTADGGAGLFATFGAAVRHVAVDTSTIYASLEPTVDLDAGADAGASGSIVAAPRDGAAPVTIVTGGAPDDLLVTGNLLFWSDSSGLPGQGAVYRASLTSAGTPTLIASGLQGPVTLATDGTNVYFASNLVGASGVTVDRTGLGGGTSTNISIVSGELTAGAITTDGTSVYFAANGLAGGEVMRVAAGGGAADVLWSSQAVHPIGLALASGVLYVAAGATGADGGILALHLSAPPTTTTLTSGAFTPTALALDGTSAYFTAVSAGAGVLARVPLGGGDTVTLNADLGSPVDLLVSDYAYVANQQGIVRVAK